MEQTNLKLSETNKKLLNFTVNDSNIQQRLDQRQQNLIELQINSSQQNQQLVRSPSYQFHIKSVPSIQNQDKIGNQQVGNIQDEDSKQNDNESQNERILDFNNSIDLNQNMNPQNDDPIKFETSSSSESDEDEDEYKTISELNNLFEWGYQIGLGSGKPQQRTTKSKTRKWVGKFLRAFGCFKIKKQLQQGCQYKKSIQKILDEKLPENLQISSLGEKLIILRIFVIVGFISGFINFSQLLEIGRDPRPTFKFLFYFYTVSMPILLFLLIATVIWPQKLWIAQFLILLCMARGNLVFFDLDEKRNHNDDQKNAVIYLFQVLVISQFMLIHNLISKNYWLMIIEIHIQLFIFYYGAIRYQAKEDKTVLYYIRQNFSFFIGWGFLLIIAAFLFKIIIDFLRNDSIAELLKRLSYQETMNKVIDNLDLILLVKDKKNISYVNNKGFEIIDEIQYDVLGMYIERLGDIFQLPSQLLLQKEDFDPTFNNKKRFQETQKIAELILNHKFFEVTQTNQKEQHLAYTSNQPISENYFSIQGSNEVQLNQKLDHNKGVNQRFSIQNFFESTNKDLEGKVFSFKKLKMHQREKIRNVFGQKQSQYEIQKGQVAPVSQLIQEQNTEICFIQVKKIEYQDCNKKQVTLQITDVSSQILFNIASGEKKLLAMINATVSHEMRNPVNSIRGQNMYQSQLNMRVQEIIDSKELKFVLDYLEQMNSFSSKNNQKVFKTLKNIKKRFKGILKQYIESVEIQSSSEQILNFLVNDLLDFAQLREGKFRKNIQNFFINKAIKDLIKVQSFKAEQVGISIQTEFKNFESRIQSQIVQKGESLINDLSDCYKVCSDLQRLQQIILNLLSNSLKFTTQGGSVKIITTFIKEKVDLTFQEPNIIQLVENAERGLLEIQVIDTGIGIKQEDLGKLFQLFGFINTTQEVNTNGIGLGLHISKMISQRLGGDIICNSEWQKGSNFTFVIALDDLVQTKSKLYRIKNPIVKLYAKIQKKLSQNISDKINKKDLNKDEFKRERTIIALKKDIDKFEIKTKRNNTKVNFDQNEDLSLTLTSQDIHQSSVQPNTLLKQQNTSKFSRNLSNQQSNLSLQGTVRQSEVSYNSSQNLLLCEESPLNELQKNEKSNSDQIVEKDKSLGQELEMMFDAEDSSDSEQENFKIFKNPQSSANFGYQQLSIDQINACRRILIVDDEPYNILGLKVILIQAGYRGIENIIEEALNGQLAYEKVKKGFMEGYSFGLIFMDCSMPVLNGYDATEKIRHFCRRQNLLQPMVVACTGHTENEYIKKAWSYQMDEVVPKPVNIEIIKEILDEVIQ